MRAPRLLLLRLGLGDGQPLGAGAREGVVAARVERELPILQVQDRAHRAVEQRPVVGDHQNGVRVAREVGSRARATLRGRGSWWARPSSSRSGAENSTAASATRIRQPPEKSEQGRDCSSASKPRPRRIEDARASADQASMSASRVCTSAMRCGIARRLSLRHERGALQVGREHRVDQRGGGRWDLLRHAADAGARGQLDRARVELQLAADQAEQRRLAGAVAAHDPDLVAGGHVGRGPLEQRTPGDGVGDRVDAEHGRALPQAAAQVNRPADATGSAAPETVLGAPRFPIGAKAMPEERTLSIIKPDATRRNLTGAINHKFEEAGAEDRRPEAHPADEGAGRGILCRPRRPAVLR